LGLRGGTGVWKEIAQEFQEEYPDIEVTTVDAVCWNLEKVITRAVGGVPYDVIYVVIEEARALISEGLVRPLDPFIERDQEQIEEFFNDVHPNLLKVFNVDGSQYLLPFEWNNMMVYYNTRLYEECGLEPPPEDWTWEEFAQIGAKLTRDTGGDEQIDIYGYMLWWPGTFFVSPWIYCAGGTVLNDDWDESTMNRS